MTDTHDYSARLRVVEMSAQANASGLAAHEDICAERYRNIHESMRAMRSDNQRTNNYLIGIGIALLTGMAGILANLVFFSS